MNTDHSLHCGRWRALPCDCGRDPPRSSAFKSALKAIVRPIKRLFTRRPPAPPRKPPDTSTPMGRVESILIDQARRSSPPDQVLAVFSPRKVGKSCLSDQMEAALVARGERVFRSGSRTGKGSPPLAPLRPILKTAMLSLAWQNVPGAPHPPNVRALGSGSTADSVVYTDPYTGAEIYLTSGWWLCRTVDGRMFTLSPTAAEILLDPAGVPEIPTIGRVFRDGYKGPYDADYRQGEPLIRNFDVAWPPKPEDPYQPPEEKIQCPSDT